MRAMRERVSKRFAILSLNSFLSISLAIHLIAFSLAASLIPDLQVHVKALQLEVSLLLPQLQSVTQERPASRVEVASFQRKESLPAQDPVVVEERHRISREEARPPIQGETREAPKEEVRLHPQPPPQPQEKHENRPVSTAQPLLMHSDLDQTLARNDPLLSARDSSPDLEGEAAEGLLVSLAPSAPEKSKEPVFSDQGSSEMAHSNPASNGRRTFVQPLYAENPRPPYPREARRKGYEGEVILKVQVLSDGGVGKIEIGRSSGYEVLDRSALAAVKRWKFTAARAGEEAVPAWVNIPIRFRLQ